MLDVFDDDDDNTSIIAHVSEKIELRGATGNIKRNDEWDTQEWSLVGREMGIRPQTNIS